MGFLGIAAPGGVLARLGGQVVGAECLFHATAGCNNGLLREMDRVRAHIGNEAFLVKALGRAHGLAGGEAQLAVGLLLQGAGGEGGHRATGGGLGLHLGHPPGLAGRGLFEGLSVLLLQKPHRQPRFDGAGVLVKVRPRGDAFASHVGEPCFKSLLMVLQPGLQVPVGTGTKGQARVLPLHQKAHRHGLHPSGGEAVGHLFPQQGREGIAHQAIQHTAHFLGLHQVLVKITGLCQRPVNGLLGDLVKHQPLHRNLGLEQLQQVPTDGFPFPVFISGQE